ncbi:MAG: twin-arginine translocase TatA/TatE family subunit [Chloroflexota bacterium]
MDIFGIGPLELVLILVLALLVFGPKDLQKGIKSLGEGMRKIVRSDTWRTVSQTSKKLRDLPTELIREAGLDEINRTMDPGRPPDAAGSSPHSYAAWTGKPQAVPQRPVAPPPPEQEIAPPSQPEEETTA